MSANQLFVFFYVPIFAYFAGRRFDLFSYVFLSSTVYFMPAFFGFVHDGTIPLTPVAITTELYGFYYFFFITLVIFSVRSDYMGFDGTRNVLPKALDSLIDFNRLKSIRYLRMTRWMSLICLILGFMEMKDAFLAESKQDFLEHQSIFFTVWQTLAVLYMLIAVLERRKLDILLGGLYCIVDLYSGFRGVTVFSLISILLLFGYKNMLGRMVFIKIVLTLTLVFVVLVGYKQLIGFIKINDLAAGLDNFVDFDSYYTSFLLSESFTQQAIFNSVIAKHFTVPADHVLSFFRILFPGISNFLFGKPVGFNDYFQPVLFRNVPWGMASNFWAEQYAMFGEIWLGMVTILFFGVIHWTNRKLMRYAYGHSNKKLCFMIFLVVPTVFLIHRNDFEFSLYLLRNSIFVLLFVMIFSERRIRI